MRKVLMSKSLYAFIRLFCKRLYYSMGESLHLNVRDYDQQGVCLQCSATPMKGELLTKVTHYLCADSDAYIVISFNGDTVNDIFPIGLFGLYLRLSLSAHTGKVTEEDVAQDKRRQLVRAVGHRLL